MAVFLCSWYNDHKAGGYMYLFQKIEEVSIQYGDARKNIAEFLLKERSHIKNYSMQQIADRTYTSKPTLVRFAKNVGYSGWTEFIKEFLTESHYLETHFSDVDPNMPFSKENNINEIIQKIVKIQIESLQDTADIMDGSKIEEAGQMILSARHVVVFGISPNTIIGELFKRKMASIGKLIYITKMGEFGITANSLNEEDCAILISYSGNNKNRDPMSYIETLKEKGVKLIGITSDGDNYIRDNIPCTLTISTHERLFTKISGFATEESINFILNIVFAYCFSLNYDENYQHKIDNSIILEKRRRTNINEIKEDIHYYEED